jgi:predicted dehydrogenase
MTEGCAPLRRTVLLVGAGAIGRVHLEALSMLRGVDVCAAVDVDERVSATFRGEPVPVYTELGEALERHRCDTVIVATPTPTHAAIVSRLLSEPPGLHILVEKPLATVLEEVRDLLDRARTGGRRISTLYHAAHAPEVHWGTHRLDSLISDHGLPCSFEASFSTPYATLATQRAAVYVSSWLDLGINALSVLSRYVDLTRLVSFRPIDRWPSTFEAVVEFRRQDGTPRQGSIVTSWGVTEPSMSTRLRFEGGAELLLDHTGVSARTVVGGVVTAMFGSDGRLPRLLSHYVPLLRQHLLADHRADLDDLALHSLLLSPVTHNHRPADGGNGGIH